MRHSPALAIMLSVACAAGSAAAQDWSKVRIATEGAYPPWNFTDASGRLVGFEVDLANDLCARMEIECEIIAQDWEGIIPALQNGKYDVIMAGMAITDERRQVIQFTDPYAATPAALVVLKDSELADHQAGIDRLTLDEVDEDEQAAIDRLRDLLDGATVGVQVATTHANFLEQYMAGTVDIRKYDTQENLDLDLQAGRVDAALASMSYWQPLFKTDKGAEFAAVGPTMTGGPFGAGVGAGVRQGDDQLVQMFNEAIAAAKADGTIAELTEQWFGFDASA